MQTTLHRHDLYRFERLVNKLVRPSELPTAITFSACPGGGMLTAFCENAAMSMTVPDVNIRASEPVGKHNACQVATNGSGKTPDYFPNDTKIFSVPWSALKELMSKKDGGNVDFDVTDARITATWSVNGIPQRREYIPPKFPEKRIPTMPENSVTHPMRLFDVLADAAKCTETENARNPLGGICLRGGKVIATDGRQAFLHDGFAFPWENDVLCPTSRIFGSKEIREFGDVVRLGVTGNQVGFQVESVTFWFKQIDGRFPKLDQLLEKRDKLTWLRLEPGDAEFTLQRLDNMPGNFDHDSPVYLVLNHEAVTIRGHDRLQKSATELQLNRSHYEGGHVFVPMNRRFLKNALEFGIHCIGFDAVGRGHVIGYDVGNSDSQLTFLWMPLEGDESVCDAEKLTTLASDVKTSSATRVSKIEPVKSIPAKQPPVLATAARRISVETNPVNLNTIQTAEALCTSLYETLQNTRRLVRHLKQQKKQDRLVRNTLESLKQLQGICV